MKLKLSLAALLLAGSTGFASAADEIILLRQALMNANQESAKTIVAMLRRQIPFDAAIAAAALSTVAHDSEVLPTFFPAGTEAATDPANKSEARPEVWSDMDGFRALADKMAKDAAAAAAAAAGDQQAFLAAFKTVSDNCNACHEKYRIESDD